MHPHQRARARTGNQRVFQLTMQNRLASLSLSFLSTVQKSAIEKEDGEKSGKRKEISGSAVVPRWSWRVLNNTRVSTTRGRRRRRLRRLLRLRRRRRGRHRGRLKPPFVL